jgi:IclR family transcriptional regulator, acetate operon repressor
MRNKPAYPLQSVDSALRLAQMLQASGPIRLSDVAAEFEIGVSTAHRLLSALVYRGFAEQLPDRRYGPGMALRPMPVLDATVSELRERSQLAMANLVEAVGESVNLVVLADMEVYFVATVECARVLRVGERTGQRLPAHLTSGGKAILSRMADSEIDRYRNIGAAHFARLKRELLFARRDGYASNHQETERGLTAIGVAFEPLPRSVSAAVCIAMPTVRFRRTMLKRYVAALRDTAHAIASSVDDPGQTNQPASPDTTRLTGWFAARSTAWECAGERQ